MTEDVPRPRSKQMPSSRVSRLSQFGRLAGGIAGGVIAEGARRLANGERPSVRDTLLTPGNFIRLADRLAHLRGAAMKVGQMISLDAGDLLPAELTSLLAALRERAYHMPPSQLQQVLSRESGADWRSRFARFDPTPMAAASIGQVHRATTLDGRDLAIKVQYPGVRESIDADVDNVATLLRMSGLLPRGLDIQPLLSDAKAQLHEEADYKREAKQMALFADLVADTPNLIVPDLVAEHSTSKVLAMTFVHGEPIEDLIGAPQEVRDNVTRALVTVVVRELFEFGVMQTDPNFANYRYDRENGRLALLDFGATRVIAPATVAAYRSMISAGLRGDGDGLLEAALVAGIVGRGALDHHRSEIDAMVRIVVQEITRPGAFDFGNRSFVSSLRDLGMSVAADQRAWHVPPSDILFTQRKISGTALLAARLQARVDVRDLLAGYL